MDPWRASPLVACAVLPVAVAAACGSSEIDPSSVVDAGRADRAADGSVDGGPLPPAFGLDIRPSNSTCLAPARPHASSPVKFERVFAGVNLANAITIAQPPGDPSRWFAVQHGLGNVVSFPAVAPAATTLACDVGALSGTAVDYTGEGGILKIAFHPKFAQNGRLYLSWTSATESILAWVRSTDGGLTFTEYGKLLSFPRGVYHCGGGLAFGADGLLYASFGDAGGDANGQKTTGFYSRVLRLDVDTPAVAPATYVIPEGNPFRAGGGEPATFAWGFRNPFRISIDRATNDLWLGDVGQTSWEEIDVVRAGENHGWPCREGAHDTLAIDNGAFCPSRIGFTDPVVEHAHPATGGRAVIGGVVYRGKAMPALAGTYVYGDFVLGELRLLTFDTTTGLPTSTLVNDQGPADQWTDIVEDLDGEVYAVGGAGIYKMVPAGVQAPSTFPDRLSKTGCFDPSDPKRPAAGVVPFRVAAELWSDGAEKERGIAIPDGTTVTVQADGDFDVPTGSVLTKTFMLGGKRVETRLLVRHSDGDWAGYSYEWDDAQSDAVLLASSKTKRVGSQEWFFPSRADCMRCHTAPAGRTLGLELGQLNGDLRYPSTNRVANQLRTLDHIGFFGMPLSGPVSSLPAYPDPHGSAAVEARARAYLHANCAHCHRPGVRGRATMDLRFGTQLSETKTCGVASLIDDLGVVNAKILAPSSAQTSLLSMRAHRLDGKRMPPLASSIIDVNGLAVIDAWIKTLAVCP